MVRRGGARDCCYLFQVLPLVIETVKIPTLRACALGLLVVLVAGCASTPPAPVVDRSPGARKAPSARDVAPRPTGGVHRVQRGDTLYSIAFRNGLDYRELARINGIAAPYTIYVGQEIRLDARAAKPPASSSNRQVAATSPSTSQPAANKPVTAGSAPSGTSQFVVTPLPPSSTTPKATASTSAPSTSTSPPQTTPTKPAAPNVPPVQNAPATNAAASGITWRWPADGPRVAHFVPGDQTKQGIDIAGRAGDPVRAASDGEVVYSGNGLIGYGELIIVKHNASLLSAYGHNRRRLVQEGDKVKAGQQIAEMGSSSASRDMLHFEIRRNGKPVDPLGFLPPR
jgi:lipoprotein NlpD